MAFDNVTFPSFPMIHGVKKNISDPIGIASNGSYEYRVRKQRWERYSWSIPTQTMTDAQKETIREFLTQRNHALNSFTFSDPDYTTFTDAVMVYNSSDKWNLALPFNLTTGGTHPIFNPTIGGLTITVDDAADTIDSFSILNGVPVIQVIGTSGSEVIKVTGPVHFTVRLGSNFETTIFALDGCNRTNEPVGHIVNDIQLVEVYGEY